MGHLRRLGGRWSALGGAWPDPKGPGRCLPTPWVPGSVPCPSARSGGREAAHGGQNRPFCPLGPWQAPTPFGHVRVPCDRPRCLSCPWPVPSPPGVLPGRWVGLGAVALVYRARVGRVSVQPARSTFSLAPAVLSFSYCHLPARPRNGPAVLRMRPTDPVSCASIHVSAHWFCPSPL